MAAQPEPSERVARTLRDEPPELDDVARARMEKRLVAAVRAREGGGGADLSPRPRRGRVFGAGVLVGVAVAAAAALVLLSERDGETGAPAVEAGSVGPLATFEAREGERVVSRGAFAEGEQVRTGVGQTVRVALGESRFVLAEGSAARFGRLDAGDVRIHLSEGAIDVAFHPARRGEQELAVQTSTARVEVVGTEFRVAIAADGATEVSVSEGTVRVVPLPAGHAQLVSAGERLRVAPTVERSATRAQVAGTEADRDLARALPTEASEASSGNPEPAAGEAPSAEVRAALEGRLDTESAAEALQGLTSLGRRQHAAAVGEAPPPLSADLRFELAQRFFDTGRFADARHELYAVARGQGAPAARARAWSMVAESWAREGDPRQAAEAYRRATTEGGTTDHGLNALYALARLSERELGDRVAARASYGRYLELAPRGALASAASEALCRLGDASQCGAPQP